MTSSRRETTPRQVPAPANSRTAASYTRFIPREELQDFASWTPGAFNTPPPEQSVWPAGQGPAAAAAAPAAAPAPAEPPPPSAQDLAEAHEAALEAALRAEIEAEFDQRLQREATAQAQAARQQGYQDGYRDGLVALDSFKQSFAQQTSAQIGSLVLSLDSELRALEQQMAATVARVATELARQVVRSELATRPALVTQVAQEAINAVLMSARHITVQVHPDDHAMVAQGCAEALAARGARLLANPALARGGCVVDSDAGTIDARIAQRWQRATQALGTGQGWSDGDIPGADA